MPRKKKAVEIVQPMCESSAVSVEPVSAPDSENENDKELNAAVEEVEEANDDVKKELEDAPAEDKPADECEPAIDLAPLMDEIKALRAIVEELAGKLTSAPDPAPIENFAKVAGFDQKLAPCKNPRPWVK